MKGKKTLAACLSSGISDVRLSDFLLPVYLGRKQLNIH